MEQMGSWVGGKEGSREGGRLGGLSEKEKKRK